jgi:glycosyltransferase involved in cell wall biosynthesis
MRQQLRILFFSSGLSPEYGGAAISEASLCQSLESAANVLVACREDRWNRKFVRNFGLKNILEFVPSDFYHCWRENNHPCREWFRGIDVVHLNGHWRWEYYFISKICQEMSIPYVVHPRGMMLVGGRKHRIKQVFNFLIGNPVAKAANKVIALSRFETEQLAPYGLSNDATVVIPNGVCGFGEATGETYATPTSDHFLYFGRIEHRKNLLFLLDSFAKYRQLGGTKKLRLKGPVEHGYEQLVVQKIEELHLGHHVSLLAPSYGPDKWRHLGQAVAVVYPCLDEPFGRVPFETLIAGSLPIVPQESGGAEYLNPVLPEAIYPTNDSDALAKRLLWAENLSEELRGKTLSAARDWVENNLDWKKISHRILELYSEVTTPGPLTDTIETDLSSPHPA